MFLLGLLLVLVVPSVTAAATIHVPGDQPTIQAGVDASAAGDTVAVACGTYHEHDILLKSGVVVRGDAGGCVIVDAESLGRVFQGSFLDSTTVLSGFVVREGRADSMDSYGTLGGGLFLFDGSPRIENCVFESNYAESGGGVAALLSDPRLDECVFRNNMVYGSFPATAAGIYALATADVRAHRCLFLPGGDVSSREAAKVTLSRCTFFYSELFAGVRSEVIADRSVFYESSIGCFTLWDPGRGEVTCSLVESLPGGCIDGSDNILGDPLFCSLDYDDLTVSGNSPCLQTGGVCQGIIGAFGVGCDEEFVDVVVTTSPAGLSMVVDTDTTISPATFLWPRFSEHEVSVVAEYRYDRGRRYAFDSWSDAGERVHDLLVLNPPYEFVASYEHQYDLEIVVDTESGDAHGGYVLPGGGWFPADGDVEIQAVPGDGFAFASWVGSGNGSYTGADNPAIVSMHGPLTQVARFVPVGYEFRISASSTDPSENHGTPSGGLRNLYLWLTCANGGLQRFEAAVTGTLTPFGFVPAEGILSFGGPTDLDLLALNCITGEAPEFLLGSWLVVDTGGTLCLGPLPGGGPPRVSDCTLVPDVTLDPGITGFSSDGNPPCRIGTNTCASTPTAAPGTRVADDGPAAGSFSVAPNPFTERTTVALFLKSPAEIDLRVFDVAGRSVATLAEGVLAADGQRLSWDGRDHQGQRVASGTYFVRLQAGGETQTRKVVFRGD